MYTYIKQPPISQEEHLRQLNRQYQVSRFKRLLPTILITLGASLLISVVYPIFSYELFAFKNQSRRPKIISPVPDTQLSQAKGFISPASPTSPVVNNRSNYPNQPPSVLAASDTSIDNDTTIDYTQIENWFPFDHPQDNITSNTTHYALTIPKLNIKDAVVTIGGDNLEKSLIHYGGTALPGLFGNAVIFGHSTLPSFYNPKNYISIFSLIPTLEPGDDIYIYFDGITYKYLVTEYYEVSPDEIDILEQRYDRKEITLVTCVPPGTYWKRGIIKAQLSSVQ